ncbi:MAG: hypothetical protein FWH15_01230 [Betaproteobacteria bacterium]|nr:hypothetical protein [Betaproteobacteria bacterium]
MTPLEFIIYIVEHLQGTPYEPWVDFCLFLLLVAAIISIVMFLLGSARRRGLAKAITAGSKALRRRRGYSPEWEAFRLRVEPYAQLLSSIYFAFVGIYSALLVGLSAISAHFGDGEAPWWAYLVAVVWVSVSFIYARVNLESASWAHHEIKARRHD